MTRERRSLWGSISTSRKVNAVSLGAALLYTWAIPHFDDEGFLDGEIEQLKAKIVPIRPEFGQKRLKRYVNDLEKVGLWRIFRDNQRIIIYDPAFSSHQIFHGFQKRLSNLKSYILDNNPTWFTSSPNEVDTLTRQGTREVKGSKEKRREGLTPNVDNYVEISSQPPNPPVSNGQVKPEPKPVEEMTPREFEDSLKKSFSWTNFEYEMKRYRDFLKKHPTFRDSRQKIIVHFNSIPKPLGWREGDKP